MSKTETSAGIVGIASAGRSGHRAPILFLHGVGSDKSVWQAQLDHFKDQRLALAIDFPGYGESEFKAAATRDDFARAALAALDALGIERTHVCGLSLGGVVAIALHALAPSRCASLTLADSFAVHPQGAEIYQRAVSASHSMTMSALADTRAPILLGAGASAEVRAEIIATMGQINPAAYQVGAAAVWLAEQTERAAAIKVPTLVLVGDEDRITPPALSDALAALIPGARRSTITGAGHLANIEQPTLFNRAMDDFLSECDEIDES